jgi:hypothetical protein
MDGSMRLIRKQKSPDPNEGGLHHSHPSLPKITQTDHPATKKSRNFNIKQM